MEAWRGLGVKGSIVLDDVSFREAKDPSMSIPTTATTTTTTLPTTKARTASTKKDATYARFPCAMDRDTGPCRKNMSRFFYNYRQVLFTVEASLIQEYFPITLLSEVSGIILELGNVWFF